MKNVSGEGGFRVVLTMFLHLSLENEVNWVFLGFLDVFDPFLRVIYALSMGFGGCFWCSIRYSIRYFLVLEVFLKKYTKNLGVRERWKTGSEVGLSGGGGDDSYA